jgi:peroxiredoxin
MFYPTRLTALLLLLLLPALPARAAGPPTESPVNALLNKPAPDFSTTDIDGHPYKLSDFRGKVVLLDFWFRDCPWCIRAMPQLKQLADDFKGQPVAILGMNTDQDPADARRTMKEMSLNYPTLIAGPYPEKLNVQAYPTLIVIDRQGIIRDVHEGFSPTLRQDIGDRVRALLQNQK